MLIMTIKPELTIKSTFAAEASCPKQTLRQANKFYSTSPIPSEGARLPISDCVQNHIAKAATVATTRNSIPNRNALPPEAASDMRGGFQGELASFSQIQLACSQVRQFFDAHELVVTRAPQCRQIALS